MSNSWDNKKKYIRFVAFCFLEQAIFFIYLFWVILSFLPSAIVSADWLPLNADCRNNTGLRKRQFLELEELVRERGKPHFKVFRYSFSGAIPIFFNRFKSDSILV